MKIHYHADIILVIKLKYYRITNICPGKKERIHLKYKNFSSSSNPTHCMFYAWIRYLELDIWTRTLFKKILDHIVYIESILNALIFGRHNLLVGENESADWTEKRYILHITVAKLIIVSLKNFDLHYCF